MAVEEDVFTTSSYSISSLTQTSVEITLSGRWITKQINGNLGSGVLIVETGGGGSVINGTVSYSSMSGTTTAIITGQGLSPGTEYAIPECAGNIFYDGARLDIPTRIDFTTLSEQDDTSFLNKRGLAYFWDKIDNKKQNKLTAGSNITISGNTISASQPTVNNGQLTIQKNGSSVGTFTANQSGNTTANITVPTKTSDLTNDGSDGTAAYLETDETAYKTASIPYGQCDSTSTSTAYTATVPGVTELRDGVCMWLKNGVVTSVSGFTININNLGAKPVYNNMAAATRDTTIWNANYTMFFVYDSTRVEGGCWILYRGYNSDNNTIGYQLRTNGTSLPTADRTSYYRILFTSADNTHWVPANTQYDNSATSNKTINQRKINPFGRIVYLGNSTSYLAEAAVSATAVWDQYAFSLGYSFSKGSALTMTFPKPVYIKCAPQTDGSAIIDSTTPYVQDLPSTDDGKIYIYLGVAYSATNVEMVINHPIYYYKDGAIREWSNAPAAIASVAWGDITGTLSNQTDLNTALGAKANSADLATVATSGSYNDLSNKPTIPAAQVNSDWNATSGKAQILNKPTLATVATSGSYNDLSNKPTIPAAQVQSNWTQTTTTAVDYIKNKPTLATVATSGSYNDLSNKPTIPTVGNATLTIQKNGTNVQTFTANATSNKTANITVPTTVLELSDSANYATTASLASKQDTLIAGDHIDITSNTISATDYVHSEQPVSTTAVTPVVTNSMITNGTITADKFATGAVLKLTMSTTDIGEGAALATNTLYGVYS